MSLEKEMAPHSSILAWKIPWTEQPELWVTTVGTLGIVAHSLLEEAASLAKYVCPRVFSGLWCVPG